MSRETDRPSSDRVQSIGDIEDILDRSLRRSLLSNSQAAVLAASVNRQRWFGLKLMVLACFCVVIGSAPWPTKGEFDLAIWSGYALMLALVGAFHSDRASRREMAAATLMQSLPASRPTQAQRCRASLYGIK